MRFFASSFLALAFCTLCWAQACNPADPLTPPLICDLRSGFGGSQVNPQVIPRFLPVGILEVDYGTLSVASAMQLAPARVNFPPTVYFNQTAGTTPTGPKYVLLMVDPDAPTPQSPTSKDILHWMLTDLQVDAKTLALGGGTEIGSYIDPAPPAGSDPHRYVFLLYTQPAKFSLPAALKSLPATASGARVGFNLAAFVAAAGLGDPVSGNFFKSAANTPGAPAGATAGPTADPLTNVVTPTAGGPVTGGKATASPLALNARPPRVLDAGAVVAMGIGGVAGAIFEGVFQR